MTVEDINRSKVLDGVSMAIPSYIITLVLHFLQKKLRLLDVIPFRGCCGYMEILHEVIYEVVGLRFSTLQ